MMKKGFTLAEVLITIGIIGVVAALTLPPLIQDYREQATVTRVKKFYSVFSQAYAMAVQENGTIDNWGLKDTEMYEDDDGNSLHSEESFEEYDKFLVENDCDFVGTRLHAGIKAMQRYRRAIIIIVDNRARSMKRDYNLNCIERDNIDEQLETYINGDFKTDIHLNTSNIEKWKNQFK